MAQTITDAQRATFEPYVREWMRDEFHGTTVTPDGRAEVAAGLRQCYEAAGLPWPDRVVWVSSPQVGEVIAVKAAVIARRHRATGQRRRATMQWRRATATWRRRRIRGCAEALVQSLQWAGIRLGPVLAGIVVGWMAGGRWLGAILGAFIGNTLGRRLWEDGSKNRCSGSVSAARALGGYAAAVVIGRARLDGRRAGRCHAGMGHGGLACWAGDGPGGGLDRVTGAPVR